MLITPGAIVIGLGLLAWGGDRFISGASSTARNLGISPVIVGLTIVGFATSAPEMLVSAIAAWSGAPGLAIGNAVGSNIANLGLVLGVAALVRPLQVRSSTLRREYPALLASVVLPYLLLIDGVLSVPDSVVLLAGLGGIGYWLTARGVRTGPTGGIAADDPAKAAPGLRPAYAVTWLIVGFVALLIGAQLLVFGGKRAALGLGISDVVVGLTIVAIGTSLPELAVSVAAARRNQPGLVLGNMIGSNIFNMLAVVGIAGVLSPHSVERDILTLHYPVMAALTLAFFFLTYNRGRQQGMLSRKGGAILLSVFIIYHGVVALGALGL